MYKLLIAAAAAAFAVPAVAQGPGPADPLERDIVRAIPQPEDIEAMAPALDRLLGALLTVDVGPIVDAADPYRRRPGYGRPGRTLGALGSRDDPYFEDRMRSSIYGATADMSRMMGAFAAAAPALAQSVRQMEHALGAAIDEYDRRGDDPRVRRERDERRDDPRDD
jgi:hypothetical protein